MSKSPVHFDKELAATLEGLASANSVSVALIIAAMRNASVWEVIGGGGILDARTLSAESKAELHTALSNILTGLWSRLRKAIRPPRQWLRALQFSGPGFVRSAKPVFAFARLAPSAGGQPDSLTSRAPKCAFPRCAIAYLDGEQGCLKVKSTPFARS